MPLCRAAVATPPSGAGFRWGFQWFRWVVWLGPPGRMRLNQGRRPVRNQAHQLCATAQNSMFRGAQTRRGFRPVSCPLPVAAVRVPVAGSPSRRPPVPCRRKCAAETLAPPPAPPPIAAPMPAAGCCNCPKSGHSGFAGQEPVARRAGTRKQASGSGGEPAMGLGGKNVSRNGSVWEALVYRVPQFVEKYPSGGRILKKNGQICLSLDMTRNRPKWLHAK